MKSYELPIKVEGILYARNADQIKYLLLHRTPAEGDFWQPLTGTLVSHESLIDCLYREIREEIGVEKSLIKTITDEVYKFEWKRGDQTILEFVFGVELASNQVIILSSEHDAYSWCTFEEALSLLGRENNRRALESFHEVII